jgi:excinuclease ABC subunit B
MSFNLSAPFHLTSDQPEPIHPGLEGINKGYKNQVLLDATGTGKTCTMAQVITQLQRPALVANSHMVCPAVATRLNVFDLSDD